MIPSGWCEDPEKSKFLFRLYSVVPCSIVQIAEHSKGQTSLPTEDGVPIWLGLCELEADGLLRIGNGLVHSDPETGQINISTHVENFDLPHSAYFLLATPHEIDGKAFTEAETASRLNRAETQLSMHFGSNAVYRCVFEAIFETKAGGQYSVAGGVMAVVQSSDGPSMTSTNWSLLEEATSRIENLEDQMKKDRIRRALEFYHGGKTSPDTAHGEKFFFYWTALQILCEGKGTLATNVKFQKIYSFSKEEVEDKLFWKGILEARNDFFHTGKRVHLYKDAERYLQLMFLDLMRYELSLSAVHAALSAQPHLDLSLFA